MENICQMDCHNCNLQEGDLNKAICAAKFAPAMFRKILMLVSDLAAHVEYTPSINEVLPFGGEPADETEEIKPIKKTKNESVKEES